MRLDSLINEVDVHTFRYKLYVRTQPTFHLSAILLKTYKYVGPNLV